MNHHRIFTQIFRSFILMVASLALLTNVQHAQASSSITPWWPTSNTHLQGAQPFKAALDGGDLSSYDMYWQVDGGALNVMQDSKTDAPHKEAIVDVSGWNWHDAGPYTLTFVAKEQGVIVGSKDVTFSVDASPSPVAPVTVSLPTPSTTPLAAVQVWWPTKNAVVTGVQPLKSVVTSMDINSYTMFWQVDGGALNPMTTNYSETPHKEASIDMSTWHWQSSGVYTLTFTAKDLNGKTIASYSEPITVGDVASPTATAANSTTAPTSTPAPAPSHIVSSTLSDLYVDTHSAAAVQADAWASARPYDATAMRTLAAQPTATWLGEWSGDISSAVSATVHTAAKAGKTALLVAYNIPQRDCGGYSAGGSSDYKNWITSFANGIGTNSAVVILEPDSVAQSGCLSSSEKSARFSLLSYAITTLKSHPHTLVYLDAGHAGWVDAKTMARNLTKAGIASADGFSLNVSNFDSSENEIAYGNAVSAALGGTHFVIDTSRNGNGSNGDWCNPSGRAIGTLPSTQTGITNLDATLWIKTPGESDGTCNGGPSAGSWYPDYALSLVQNAH
jgi:endoglucanase